MYVHSFVGIFSAPAGCNSDFVIPLSGTVGRGTSDREWSGEGGVQEYGEVTIETNGGVLAGEAGEQNCPYFCRTLLKPMETHMENSKKDLTHPFLDSCLRWFCYNRTFAIKYYHRLKNFYRGRLIV